MRISTSLALSLLITTALGAQSSGGPAWVQAERAIRADYAKRESSTKILEIAQGERELWPFWVAYSADVSLEREGGRRDSERVGVSYWLVRGSWELEGVQLLGRRALADVKPPSSDAALQLLSAAWSPDKCEGYVITQVKMEGEPRFQRTAETDPSKDLRSYIYSVEVLATGNGKFRMSEQGMTYSNRTQNLLTWDAERKGWWVDPRQVRCTGWVKQGPAATQAAVAATSVVPASMSKPENPPAADAVTVFTQAWTKLRPDFSVVSIAVKGQEAHAYQERRWITYKLSITATGTDKGSKSMMGKTYVCEPADYASLLKWDAEARMWKVDEGMVRDFNESSCTARAP